MMNSSRKYVENENNALLILYCVLLSVISRQSRSCIPIQFRVCILVFINFSKLLLFWSVNVNTSAAEERVLLTGLHEVADVYCDCCKTLLGWKYVNIHGIQLDKIIQLLYICCRNMRSNQARSIRKENTLSNLYIWSRIMVGMMKTSIRQRI